ncbi:MAG: hypothetical protein WBC78_23040, partial [Candidatus Sulfotelmatobacter sp.]
DTGFLDRMLKRPEDKSVDSKSAEIAAIAAGMFAVLGATPSGASNGTGGNAARVENANSNWRTTSRREALR